MFKSTIKDNIAAIYVRVSTEEQAVEGHSISAQIETLTQYCQLFGIQIYKVYQDLGISGKDTVNRPGLNQLIKDSKKNLFNQVLVWKISRLSRSLKDLLTLVDSFEKNGVSFISYSEKFDTSTPVGKMTLQILGSIAEFERNTIIENVKLGLSEVARKGKKSGGAVLGYDFVDTNLVVNENEANTVRLIYNMYVNTGTGMRKISNYLNEHGYKSKKGNKFGHDTVGIILANPIYIGINRHQIGTENEYQIEGNHEAIITKELWDKAQDKRKRRANLNERRHEEGVFLLGGLMKCPACSSAMVGAYGMSYKNLKGGKKSYRYSYYKCNKHTRNSDCSGHWIAAHRIENQVINYIKNLSNNHMLIEDTINKSRQQAQHQLKPHKNEHKSLSTELASLKQNKEKLFALYLSGKLNSTNEVVDKINTLDAEIVAIDNKLKQYEDSLETINEPVNYDNIKASLDTFTKLIDIVDDQDKKQLIRSLVKEVKLTPDRTIDYIELKFGIGEEKVYRF